MKGKKSTKAKETYFFQGQYVILKHWFDVDIDWVEEITLQGSLSFRRGFFKHNI